jgi:hypothetical protein
MIGGVPINCAGGTKNDPRLEQYGETACCGGGIYIDENGEKHRRKGCAC